MASLVAGLQGCVSGARNSVDTVRGRGSGTVGNTRVDALMDACRAAVAVQYNDLAQNIKISSPPDQGTKIATVFGAEVAGTRISWRRGRDAGYCVIDEATEQVEVKRSHKYQPV
jgi:hypothetical protein